MHRGASCAKMVENYQDARWPRSAQGVMPLKVIAVLMPFTNVPFAYQSERQSQAPSKSGTPIAPAAVLSLPSRAASGRPSRIASSR